MPKLKDITNQTFGRLTALHIDGRNKEGKIIWKCQCICGNYTRTLARDLHRSHTKSCGCLKIDNGRKWGKQRKREDGLSSFNALYGSYKRRSKKKNIKFDLSKEQFRNLTSQNCYYCEIEPKQEGWKRIKNASGAYIYNGIDRIDYMLGYVANNCVPCCEICNIAKHTMNQEEFSRWIQRLCKNRFWEK